MSNEVFNDNSSDDCSCDRSTLPDDTIAALNKLFGSWDEEQVREFNEAIAEMDKIDDDMWK
jgi:hypothetical protein